MNLQGKEVILYDPEVFVPNYSGKVYQVLRKRENRDGTISLRVRCLHHVVVTNTTGSLHPLPETVEDSTRRAAVR